MKDIKFLELADCYLSANDIELAEKNGWIIDYNVPFNDGDTCTVYYPYHCNKSEFLVSFTLFIIDELGKEPYDVFHYYY